MSKDEEFMSVESINAMYPRLKPYKALTQVNEFASARDLYNELQRVGITELYVEPKIDGASCLVLKYEDDVRIIASIEDITAKFPLLVEDIQKIPYNFVIHGEIVVFDTKGNYLPHEDAVAALHRKEIHTKDNVHILAFDLLNVNSSDIRSTYLFDRKTLLTSVLINTNRILELPYCKVDLIPDSEEDLLRAIQQVATEEGIVTKGRYSTYSREGSKEWFKLKKIHSVDVAIIEKKLVKNSKCTFNFQMGILNDEGTLVWCGRSMNSNCEAEIGDIIEVRCDRIIPNAKGFNLYLARVSCKRDDKREPDSFELLRKRTNK